MMLGVAGCAQAPQQVAAGHPKEYFPSSVYGPASRRVVADGQPIPRGGGQYLVGKPYTIAGQTYYPSERKVTQVGLASWYGDAFHGRLTANGEVFDRDGFTAAHPTMPLPSYARVTNLRNQYSMIVRVNDRGPYHSNRVMDVSRRVADALDFQRGGTAKIKVEYVGRASLAGSDNGRLYATLHRDGPSGAGSPEERALVAEAGPAPVASLAAPAEPDRGAAPGASSIARARHGRAAALRPAAPPVAATPRPVVGERGLGRGDRGRPALLAAGGRPSRLAKTDATVSDVTVARTRLAAARQSAEREPGRAGMPVPVPRALMRTAAGQPGGGRPAAAMPSSTRRVQVATVAETVHRSGGGLRLTRSRED